MTSIIQSFDNKIELLVFTSKYKSELYAIASQVVHHRMIKFFPFILIIYWYWFKSTPQQTSNRRKLIEGVLISLLAILLGRLLALKLPFRERPFLNPDLINYIPDPHILRSWSSFPSDHAVLAFALATSLFRISPRVGIWAYIHAAIFICMPRLAEGYHYASDLIGGAIIGTLIACIFYQVQLHQKLVDYIQGVEKKFPEIFYVTSFILLYEIIEMFESFRYLASLTFSTLRHMIA